MTKATKQGVAPTTRETPNELSKSNSHGTANEQTAEAFFWNFRKKVIKTKPDGGFVIRDMRALEESRYRWLMSKETYGSDDRDTQIALTELRETLLEILEKNSSWSSLTKAQRAAFIETAQEELARGYIAAYLTALNRLGGNPLHAVIYAYAFGLKKEFRKARKKRRATKQGN